MRIKRLHLDRRVDWALLAQKFPAYAEQIKRIRNSQTKLITLRIRLVKKFGYWNEKMVVQ